MDLRTFTIDTIHSPHDDGYYAEVIDANGKTVYTTPIKSMRCLATYSAKDWVACNQ